MRGRAIHRGMLGLLSTSGVTNAAPLAVPRRDDAEFLG